MCSDALQTQPAASQAGVWRRADHGGGGVAGSGDGRPHQAFELYGLRRGRSGCVDDVAAGLELSWNFDCCDSFRTTERCRP